MSNSPLDRDMVFRVDTASVVGKAAPIVFDKQPRLQDAAVRYSREHFEDSSEIHDWAWTTV
jgi:hypothetical protein